MAAREEGDPDEAEDGSGTRFWFDTRDDADEPEVSEEELREAEAIAKMLEGGSRDWAFLITYGIVAAAAVLVFLTQGLDALKTRVMFVGILLMPGLLWLGSLVPLRFWGWEKRDAGLWVIGLIALLLGAAVALTGAVQDGVSGFLPLGAIGVGLMAFGAAHARIHARDRARFGDRDER